MQLPEKTDNCMYMRTLHDGKVKKAIEKLLPSYSSIKFIVFTSEPTLME